MNHDFKPLLSAVLAAGLMAFPLAAADPENGKKLARKCSVCHGKNGIARDPEMPGLAGQSAFYLEKSMKDFREGRRKDRRMTFVVKNLTDAQIKDLAAWYAAFKISVERPDL